jgi:N-acetylmuramoyl-L-alanine amidase
MLLFDSRKEKTMAIGTVVIDPGHGGTGRVGESDGNHAVSASGVKEKDLTLILANLVKSELQTAAAAGGHSINIFMTRSTDVNLGLADRAHVARTRHADRFLSIHLNASDNGPARGTETYVRRAQDNVNLGADKRFATKIQNGVFNAIKTFDPNTRDRGVKEARFGVLNDVALGNTAGGHCRAVLQEVEFLDNPRVDVLLNTGPNATQVRIAIARAMAGAIIDDLANP